MNRKALVMVVLGTSLIVALVGCRFEKPDLIPFSSMAQFCNADGEGNLLVYVKNVGVGVSPNVHIQVVFFLSGGATHVERPALGTGALGPGQTSLAIPVPMPPGCYNPDCDFRITVDVLNEVVESDETNNTVDGSCLG